MIILPILAATALSLTSPAPVTRAPTAAAELSVPIFAVHYVQAPIQSLPPGVARTAVDHSFAPRGLVGSMGYLCGVNSSAPGAEDIGGPASSYGRGTTFLGAKLSYAFH